MEPATCWVDALREVVPERVGWVTLPVPFHFWCPPWGLPVDFAMALVPSGPLYGILKGVTCRQKLSD